MRTRAVHSVRNVHRGRATRSVGQPASEAHDCNCRPIRIRPARDVSMSCRAQTRTYCTPTSPRSLRRPTPPSTQARRPRRPHRVRDGPGADPRARLRLLALAPALRPQATARGACAHGARVHRTGRSKRNEGLLISQYIDNNTVSERTRSRTDGIRAVRVPSESFTVSIKLPRGTARSVALCSVAHCVSDAM